jgi:hypothetical protein
MTTVWTPVAKSNTGLAEVDFLFSDGVDFVFSDSTDFVFRAGTNAVVWTNPTKNTASYTNQTKN